MNGTDKYLKQLLDQDNTPGLSYIFFDEHAIKYSFHGGRASIEDDKPVDATTTFDLFSITKTFTAVAILQLADQGKIDIDHPVDQYLADFPYAEKPTIRQVMSHLAGIPSPIPLSWMHLVREHQQFDESKFFTALFLKHNKLKSTPNQKWSYSNLGYYLLGRLIEEVSGITYQQYVTTYILSPAGANLSFTLDESTHATGYQKVGLVNFLLKIFIDKSQFMGKRLGKWIPFNDFYINGASFGGLIGGATELAKYGQELLKIGSSLVSESSRKMMFTPSISGTGKELGIGLCWYWGKMGEYLFYEHTGGGCGFYSELRVYPELRKGSIILLNRTGIMPERLLSKTDLHLIEW